jgi:hypothetical protein
MVLNHDKVAKTVRPEDNPYTPNAGAEPRYLAGREHELDAFRVLLRRKAS